MNRRIRMLGLALVAVLSMGVLGASGAQALQFTAASYPVTVSGEQTAGKTHVFTYQGRAMTCRMAKFDPIGSYVGPSNSTKVTPTYSECHAVILGIELPATVTHNGCVFNFTVGSSMTENQVHVECPAGQALEIHVYQGGGFITPLCTYALTSATIGGITYSNMLSDITGATNMNVPITRTGGETVPCGSASANGTYVSEGSTASAAQSGKHVDSDVG